MRWAQATMARPSSPAAMASPPAVALAPTSRRSLSGSPGTASDRWTRALRVDPADHDLSARRYRALADRDASPWVDVLGRAERTAPHRSVQLKTVVSAPWHALNAVEDRRGAARADHHTR